MKPPFAVIFDMDGVLVDSNPYHKTAIEIFLTKHRFSFTDEELKQKVWGRMNRANVDFVFEYLKIGHFFSVVLDDSHVKEGKPNPEIYLKTAQAMGFLPSQCIVFEDSLAGTTSAKNAGTKVIGVTTTHTQEELQATTHLIIDDFTQLSVDDLVKLISL